MGLRGGITALALVLAAAAAGCGGEDDDDQQPREAVAPPIRCTAPAPSSARKVRFEPKFRAGDTRSLWIEKTRRGPPGQRDLRSTATAELRVLSGGPARATMRWTPGEVVLPLVRGEPGAEFLERVEKEAGKTIIEYSTDEFGDFGEVRNLAFLRAQSARTVDVLERLLAGHPEQAETVRATRELVQSDSFIQTVLVEDVGMPHGIYGTELVRDEPRKGPTELPSPFGGEPIPGTVEVRLVTPRDASGCAVAELVLDPDRRLMIERLVEGANRFGGSYDRSRFEGFRLRHRVRYTYDRGSGWVVKAEATKELTTPDGSRTDRTVVIGR